MRVVAAQHRGRDERAVRREPRHVGVDARPREAGVPALAVEGAGRRREARVIRLADHVQAAGLVDRHVGLREVAGSSDVASPGERGAVRRQLDHEHAAAAGDRLRIPAGGEVLRVRPPDDVGVAGGVDREPGALVEPAPREIRGIDQRSSAGRELGHERVGTPGVLAHSVLAAREAEHRAADRQVGRHRPAGDIDVARGIDRDVGELVVLRATEVARQAQRVAPRRGRDDQPRDDRRHARQAPCHRSRH